MNKVFLLNSNIISYEEYEDQKNEIVDEERRTAHDWESYKTQEVFDDGTQTFFWFDIIVSFYRFLF